MKKMRHEFVDEVPPQLAEDVIYVSIKYATVIHLCPCGCGSEVVTPLSPADWELRFDGESVSLFPSIGNWSLECRSHYWIVDGVVEWSDPWSKDEIEAARSRDMDAKRRYFDGDNGDERRRELVKDGSGHFGSWWRQFRRRRMREE